MKHITVLKDEAVEGLRLQPADTVVDATFGGGGHGRAILEHLSRDGCYIGIDADATALTDQTFPEATATIHLVNDNFKNITDIVRSLHITHTDAILADLGWRMEQFSNGGRGFSFKDDEPLLMTYGDPAQYEFTAYDIVNEWEEASIADVIYGYGDERYARKIASAIVTARKTTPIATSAELVACIEAAVPKRHYQKVHPATKTFQALRIAVNDELGVLETFLKDSFELLEEGGRLAIITFHSLEDRVVKQTFRAWSDAGIATLNTKKPIQASEEELQKNPRARSAKLRIITKHNVETYEDDSHSIYSTYHTGP